MPTREDLKHYSRLPASTRCHLPTLGGLDVVMPAGTEVLRGKGFRYLPDNNLDQLEYYHADRPGMLHYLVEKIKTGLGKEWLNNFKKNNGRAPQSVLVLLSDNTRPTTTPRLTVRAVLELLQELRSEGLAPKKLTFLTATGTHKPMIEDLHHRDFSRFLGGCSKPRQMEEGKALWEELLLQSRKLHIQKDPATGYPILQHQWDDPRTIIDMNTLMLGKPVQVNRAFMEHELIIIAADIEVHPYMGASGGPYKFCVIGIGGKNNFATHSPEMLSSPRTLPGTFERNNFFHTIKTAACGIFTEAKERGLLKADPISVNLLMDIYHQEEPIPFDLIVGPPAEWEKAALRLFSACRAKLTHPVDGVVLAVDEVKGYELISALRPLCNLLTLNSKENRIFTSPIENRVAVVFNPCLFSQHQSGGVATPATYAHLLMLKALALSRVPIMLAELKGLREVDRVLETMRKHRSEILSRWNSFIEEEFKREGNLGEGGQRTIRLHRILTGFGQVFVGTPNNLPPSFQGKHIPLKGYKKAIDRIYHDHKFRERWEISSSAVSEDKYERDLTFKPVADFINSLSPDITHKLPAAVRSRINLARLSVLGLQAITMGTGEERHIQAGQIITRAMHYHTMVSGREAKLLLIRDMQTLPFRNPQADDALL